MLNNIIKGFTSDLLLLMFEYFIGVDMFGLGTRAIANVEMFVPVEWW